MKSQVLDAIVFFALNLGNIILGASFWLRNRSTDQFTSGRRKIPSWVVGMSVFTTSVSSISFLALPGKAYMRIWNAIVFSLSIPYAAWAVLAQASKNQHSVRKLASEAAIICLEVVV